MQRLRKEKILFFFDNIKKEKIMPYILLLTFEKNLKKNNKDLFLQSNEKLVIKDLNKLRREDLEDINNKNIILISKKTIPIGKFNVFRNKDIKILFSEGDSYINLLNYIIFRTSPERYIRRNIEYNRRERYIRRNIEECGFHKKDIDIIYNNAEIYNYFFNIIKPTNIKNNLDNIIFFTKQFILIYIKQKNDHIIFSDIDFHLLKSKYNINTILNDIKYYENTGILTSRLGIFIYKINTFDFEISDKEIGIFYAKIYEKSIVVNNKKFNISNIKAYKIKDQRDIIEKELKIEIAEYLFKKTFLNKYSVLKVTKLEKSEIENAYFKLF